jgi:hypothetical protein
VPDAGEAVSSPIRLEDSLIDQFTEPPEAVRLTVVEPPTVSRIDVGFTLSFPGGGGGGGVVLLDGAGELGLGLVADGWGEEPWVAAGELVGEPPPGGGKPPAAGAGAPGELADPTRCDRCREPPGPPWPALDVAPMLMPGADPVPKAAAPWGCPGPPPARATATRVAAATAAATAAPAATCPCRVCHHGDLGGSSGLGKP